MTQKEKAKAYDNALDMAQCILKTRCIEGTSGSFHRKDLEDIFPQLKENENENEEIRKLLLRFVILEMPCNYSKEFSKEQCIDWLEKQCDINNKLRTMLDDSLSRETKESWNKFLDEQVEPKFKAGNWYQCTKDFFGKDVTFDKNTAYYCAKEGCLQDEYGCHIAIVKDLYDNFKLWTIDDAKDGDILISGQNIIIFKKFEEDSDCYLVIAYAGIDVNGKLQISNKHWFINSSATPANKEQRELLFFKMKEAGYEWNAEKKELKMIHVIDEGKAEMDYCFTKMMNGEKVSPIWSEEDDIFFKAIVRDIENIKYISENAKSDRINWLKSLKERITWKPSDVQMEMLKEACDKHWEPDGLDPLYMLYQDLIKLKEK